MERLEARTIAVTQVAYLVCWDNRGLAIATGKHYPDRRAALHAKNQLQAAFPRYQWMVQRLDQTIAQYIQGMPLEYIVMMDDMLGNLPNV